MTILQIKQPFHKLPESQPILQVASREVLANTCTVRAICISSRKPKRYRVTMHHLSHTKRYPLYNHLSLHSSDVFNPEPSYENGREARKVLLSLEILKWWSPGPSHASNQKVARKPVDFWPSKHIYRVYLIISLINSNPGINHRFV